MTDKPKFSAHRPRAGYAVGYGKPPVGTRFRPGQSGNPKGRPKGAKNKRPKLNEERLKNIILEEAYRDISVRDGDRNVTISMAQAVVRSLAVNAAKGQHRAQRLFAEMLAGTERQNKALADEWLQTAIEYKVEWERELQRREQHGITNLPPPVPHPDHVKINFIEGTARVVGPMTQEEVEELEMWVQRQDGLREELRSLIEQLKNTTDEAELEALRTDIDDVVKLLSVIENLQEKIGLGDQGEAE